MQNHLHRLPPELSAHIYEFAGNEKKTFRCMIRELKKCLTWKTMNKYYHLAEEVSLHRFPKRYTWDTIHHTFRYALKIHMTKDEMSAHFNNLRRCKCCKRHRENCPFKIDGGWDEQPIHRRFNDPCCTDCKCRYFKRKLSEAHASVYVY